MSRQTPLCVVGITCRLDVDVLLEKRVKSRYSHRLILTFPQYSFTFYLQIIRNLLSLPASFGCSIFKSRWNTHVKRLLEDCSAKDKLEQHFHRNKCIGGAVRLLTMPVCCLSATHRFINAEDVITSYSNLHAESKSLIMSGLSILELCLLVSAKHVLERRDGQPFNFEMVYNEYQNFAKRCSTGMKFPKYTKPVATKAFEHLLALELVRPTDSLSGNSMAKAFKSMCLVVGATQIQDILKEYPDCPLELRNYSESMFA